MTVPSRQAPILMVERIKHHLVDISLTGVSEQTVHLVTRVFSRVYWAVAASFFLMFPLLVGWSLPPRVAWNSYLVAPLVITGGLFYTKGRSPLPSVAAMVTMALVQSVAWFSLLHV